MHVQAVMVAVQVLDHHALKFVGPRLPFFLVCKGLAVRLIRVVILVSAIVQVKFLRFASFVIVFASLFVLSLPGVVARSGPGP